MQSSTELYINAVGELTTSLGMRDRFITVDNREMKFWDDGSVKGMLFQRIEEDAQDHTITQGVVSLHASSEIGIVRCVLFPFDRRSNIHQTLHDYQTMRSKPFKVDSELSDAAVEIAKNPLTSIAAQVLISTLNDDDIRARDDLLEYQTRLWEAQDMLRIMRPGGIQIANRQRFTRRAGGA